MFSQKINWKGLFLKNRTLIENREKEKPDLGVPSPFTENIKN